MRYRDQVLAITVLLVLSVLCALGSPLALASLANLDTVDWSRLADVGESYGTASAILSAVAIGGLAASFLYQAQQLRLTRLHHVRGVQRDLLMRMVEEPDLGAAVGFSSGDENLSARQHAFILAWVQYLFLSYEGGVSTKSMLEKEVFPSMFSSESMLLFWQKYRSTWLDPGVPELQRAFGKLVDRAWKQAEPAQSTGARIGHIAPASPPNAPTQVKEKRPTRAFAFASGIAMGAFAAWHVCRRRGS